jgi:hypothetical protein
LTKQEHDHVHDDLKCDLSVDDVKVEVAPKIIDDSIIINSTHVIRKPKSKVKARMVKAKMKVEKSELEKTANHLYDLEDSCESEQTLNVDFGLYQMEDF